MKQNHFGRLQGKLANLLGDTPAIGMSNGFGRLKRKWWRGAWNKAVRRVSVGVRNILVIKKIR